MAPTAEAEVKTAEVTAEAAEPESTVINVSETPETSAAGGSSSGLVSADGVAAPCHGDTAAEDKENARANLNDSNENPLSDLTATPTGTLPPITGTAAHESSHRSAARRQPHSRDDKQVSHFLLCVSHW